MVLVGGVGGGAVGEEDGVEGVDGEGLGVEVDGGAVVLLCHGGISFTLESVGLLLLLFTEGFRRRRGGATCCALCGSGLELLVDGVDLQQVLGAEGGLDGGGVCRVDLEGLGDAVDGDVDGVLVLGGEGAVGGGGCEEVADGEGEALLGGLGSLLCARMVSPVPSPMIKYLLLLLIVSLYTGALQVYRGVTEWESSPAEQSLQVWGVRNEGLCLPSWKEYAQSRCRASSEGGESRC